MILFRTQSALNASVVAAYKSKKHFQGLLLDTYSIIQKKCILKDYGIIQFCPTYFIIFYKFSKKLESDEVSPATVYIHIFLHLIRTLCLICTTFELRRSAKIYYFIWCSEFINCSCFRWSKRSFEPSDQKYSTIPSKFEKHRMQSIKLLYNWDLFCFGYES